MNFSQSNKEIAPALLRAQKNMGNAAKGAKNPFFKSSYADLNSIREVAMPALNAEGIAVLQPTIVHEGQSYVETVLMHESGEYISSLTPIIVGKQNDPQAAGSGISYARRYGLQSLLSIGAVDDDAESAMERPKASPFKPEINKRSAVVSLGQTLIARKLITRQEFAGMLPKGATFFESVKILPEAQVDSLHKLLKEMLDNGK